MNSKKVIDELKAKYPGKKILALPEDNPNEIIVEIEPTSEHPEKSLAMAVVGKSQPHYHLKTTEIYEVVRGTLTVYVDGQKHILHPGERLTVKPNTVHYAEGKEAWFLTHSSPGWTFEDHLLIQDHSN